MASRQVGGEDQAWGRILAGLQLLQNPVIQGRGFFRKKITEVNSGLGDLGRICFGHAAGPSQGIVRGNPLLPQACQSGQGLASQTRARGTRQLRGIKSGGKNQNQFFNPALALGLAGGFLKASLGGSVRIGLGPDRGREGSLTKDDIRRQKDVNDRSK